MNNLVVNGTLLIKSLKQRCQQNWESICNNFSKGVIYKIFTNLYLTCKFFANCNLSIYKKQILSRFRTSHYELPIDIGRWNDTEGSNRIRNLCKKDIGNEFHYSMCCTMLKNKRKINILKTFLRPNIVKINVKSLLSKLCKFIIIIIVKKEAKLPGY